MRSLIVEVPKADIVLAGRRACVGAWLQGYRAFQSRRKSGHRSGRARHSVTDLEGLYFPFKTGPTIGWVSRSTNCPYFLNSLLIRDPNRSARAPIEVLQEIRRERPDLCDKMEIYVDGGIRRGTDVLKALCLGAKAVGIGRPFLYAQSAYGPDGVVKVVESELQRARATGYIPSKHPFLPYSSQRRNGHWHAIAGCQQRFGIEAIAG